MIDRRRIAKALMGTLVPLMLGGSVGAPPSFALERFVPANLLREGEGTLGGDVGFLNERVNVSGTFGDGVARSRYPAEALVFGGVGAYGFHEDVDAFIRLGALVAPPPVDDRSESGLVAGIGLRYSIVGSSAAELGTFVEVDYVSALANDAKLTVGNVNLPGRIEIHNMIALTAGIGPQWWWRVGSESYIYPSLYVLVSPRFVGSGFFTQAGEGQTAQELSSVDASARQLLGFGGNVGFDLRILMLRVGAKWFGSLGGGASLEVPF